MEFNLPYKSLFRNLHANKVRYLVVGGVAMVLYGHVRFTYDLDLIVDLVLPNVLKFFKVMKQSGYVPWLPVQAEAFVNKSLRESWMGKRHMRVFSFSSTSSPWTGPVDVFVREPLPFKDMYRRKEVAKIGNIRIPIVSQKDLLFLKKRANRTKDRDDIDKLKKMIGFGKKE